MQLLTAATGDWIDLDKDDASEAQLQLDAILRQLLGAERLVLLAGLGTSMSIEGADGGQLAPSMEDLWQRAKSRVDGELWTKALEAVRWEEESGKDIELLLSRCQMARTLTGDADLETFIRECEDEMSMSGSSWNLGGDPGG